MDLDNVDYRFEERIIGHDLSHLESLEISYCQIGGEETMNALEKLTCSKKLKSLHIFGIKHKQSFSGTFNGKMMAEKLPNLVTVQYVCSLINIYKPFADASVIKLKHYVLMITMF